MARKLFDIGIFSVIDVASSIGVGWLLNFYTASTTTRITTYTTPGGGVANSNPVVADADGRFPEIWIEEGQTIKWVLTNELGAVQYSVDDVAIAETPPDIAAGLVDFLTDPTSDPLPVTYGGTGSTNAANAAAALAVLPLAGGTMTGNITRSTKGVHVYWNASGQTAGAMFITASGDPDPTSNPGEIWFGY